MDKKGTIFQRHVYANVFASLGSGKAWQGLSARLLLPKVGRAIIWLNDPTFLAPIDVHAVVVVDDVFSAIPAYLQRDYTLAIAPFAFGEGRGAVIQHAAGVRVCLFEPSQRSRLPDAALPAEASRM